MIPDDEWRKIRIDVGDAPERGCKEITLEVTNFDQGQARGITCKQDRSNSRVITCEARID